MLVSFVKGTPALLINKERVLVVGDLHIGMHLKLRESGIYFQNATERMAESLLTAYERSRAKSVVLLGDVKESITSPSFAEYKELKLFFDKLAGVEMRIVKGNHDGGLEKVLKNMGFSVPVEREILVGGVALTHGNSWPSLIAMRSKYVVVGHGHYAVMRNGTREKIWIVSKVTRKTSRMYEHYYRSAKLVVAPSFNNLIVGSTLSSKAEGYLPLLKNGFFDFKNSEVYDLEGKLVGKAGKIVSDGAR